ncbi:sporulation membrane protein YtaF [Bacillus sp. SM2101]|uniref:sporulation membrane protein YtaF n=1 Tax=Bacillus sp. SM2101 TaxID=2805366 RepID=UPI001BDEA081|nr:sporulation membrane protein YtaF [Bacillus sp. SM2101]
MVQYMSLIILAFAVSLDSFTVGFTYGLRKMSLPIKSIIIIAFCSAITLSVAMFFGNMISMILSPSIAEKIGAVVLVCIGAWVLFQFFRPAKNMLDEDEEKILFNLEIRSLGVVINILRKPMAADLDKSGTITGIEAFLLGAALSLDAFGAGLGAALLGYSPILMAASVALMSMLFLSLGLKSGILFSGLTWVKKFSFLPGVILIVLGIWKL